MDFVTHAAAGALIGRALSPWRAAAPGCALAGAAAALVPDADHVLELLGAEAYFVHHRTATHSLVFVGLATAAAAAARGGRAAAIVLAALASHLALDSTSSRSSRPGSSRRRSSPPRLPHAAAASGRCSGLPRSRAWPAFTAL